MKKKMFLFSVVFAGFVNHICAQYYYYNNKYYDNDLIVEIGGAVGGMNALTDLGGNTNPFKTLTLSSGFYAGVMYQDVVGVRLEATWGKAEAADSLNKKTGWGKLRNLSFTSPIQEIALLAEFHPLMLKYYPDGPPRLSPYVLAGVGWFSFNPQTYYDGRWVDLQPLHTEGEGFAEYKNHSNYHLSQVNIPVGGGLKYELSQLFTVRIELLYRFLFTDYLDDVSTTYIDPSLFDKYLSPSDAALAKALYSRRGEVDPSYITPVDKPRGNSNHNDAYYTFNIKLGINLGRTKKVNQ